MTLFDRNTPAHVCFDKAETGAVQLAASDCLVNSRQYRAASAFVRIH